MVLRKVLRDGVVILVYLSFRFASPLFRVVFVSRNAIAI